MDILEIPITMVIYCPSMQKKDKPKQLLIQQRVKLYLLIQLQLKKQKDYAKSEINDKTILFFAGFDKTIYNY